MYKNIFKGGLLLAVRRAKFFGFPGIFWERLQPFPGFRKKNCSLTISELSQIFFSKVRFRDTKNFSDAWKFLQTKTISCDLMATYSLGYYKIYKDMDLVQTWNANEDFQYLDHSTLLDPSKLPTVHKHI